MEISVSIPRELSVPPRPHNLSTSTVTCTAFLDETEKRRETCTWWWCKREKNCRGKMAAQEEGYFNLVGILLGCRIYVYTYIYIQYIETLAAAVARGSGDRASSVERIFEWWPRRKVECTCYARTILVKWLSRNCRRLEARGGRRGWGEGGKGREVGEGRGGIGGRRGYRGRS